MEVGCQKVADFFILSQLPDGPSMGETLCFLDDIDDGSAKEFSYSCGNDIHDIFIQRRGGEIFGYVNICPHVGTPLNMDEGQFMEKSGRYLMCHTHGALFQLDDGLCVAGPCNGARLQSVLLKIEGKRIIIQ